MSGKPVNGEAAEAGAYTTQAVFVDKWFFCHFVDGCEVVFHALAAVIAADGFIPLHAEARKTAAVGGYDDIVVGSHNLEIPTIRPELAYRTLRATFAEQ